MRATIKRLSDKENALVAAVGEKMRVIQDEVDAELAECAEIKKELDKRRSVVVKLREKLSPWAQCQAAVASAESRDKYFPKLSKDEFLKSLEEKLNG